MTQSDERALSRAAHECAAHRVRARDSIDQTKAHIRQSGAAIRRSLDLLKTSRLRDGPLGADSRTADGGPRDGK